MEYTAIAEWLNTTFAGYDSAILGFMNTLAGKAGGILTPLMKVITFLGEKGIIFFLLALAFMCFSRTRREGVCMFGAVCCGALITNIILKDMVARPRPFEYMSLYKSFWDFIGSPAESGFSFPSGHVTATAAGMTSLCFTKGKKYIAPTAIIVVLMAMSRNYLMAHFPSDVLFAAIIGVFSAFVAYLITRAIFIYLEDNDDFPFCAFVLDFDLPVRLPDKVAVVGVINNFGKSGKSGGGKRTSSHEQTRDRSYDQPRRAHTVERNKSDSENVESAFSGALRFAANAGGELLGKARGKRAARDDDDNTETASARRKSPSDWNSRWESYRTAKDSAAKAEARPNRMSDYEAELMKFSAADPTPTPNSAKPVANTHVELDDEDADMKIAPSPVGKKNSLFDFDVPSVPEPPKAEVKAASEPEPVSLADDGIDWASLGLGELADSNFTLDDEPVSAPKRRESTRSASHSGGGYRGRHEK